jgi:hypothetical protein
MAARSCADVCRSNGERPAQLHRRIRIYVERDIAKNTEAFVAYVGDYHQRGSPAQLAEIGGSFRVKRNQAVDVFLGIGFSRAAPGLFVAAGYSIRFDARKK